jgi:hypothetical protein
MRLPANMRRNSDNHTAHRSRDRDRDRDRLQLARKGELVYRDPGADGGYAGYLQGSRATWRREVRARHISGVSSANKK